MKRGVIHLSLNENKNSGNIILVTSVTAVRRVIIFTRYLQYLTSKTYGANSNKRKVTL